MASKPDSISAEIIVSMLGSIMVMNSRIEAAFLCRSGYEVFIMPIMRPMKTESSTFP